MSDEERRAKQLRYRLANHDSILAQQRARYRRDKAKEVVRHRLYRERNREACRARGRARYWRDHDKTLEQARQSYRKHRAARLAACKRYRQNPATRERRLASKRAYYRQRRAASLSWHINRVARRMKKARAWQRRQSKLLTTGYVRRLLCRGTKLKPEDFPLAIVRVARAKLRLLRAAREKKKEVTSENNE